MNAFKCMSYFLVVSLASCGPDGPLMDPSDTHGDETVSRTDQDRENLESIDRNIDEVVRHWGTSATVKDPVLRTLEQDLDTTNKELIALAQGNWPIEGVESPPPGSLTSPGEAVDPDISLLSDPPFFLTTQKDQPGYAALSDAGYYLRAAELAWTSKPSNGDLAQPNLGERISNAKALLKKADTAFSVGRMEEGQLLVNRIMRDLDEVISYLYKSQT